MTTIYYIVVVINNKSGCLFLSDNSKQTSNTTCRNYKTDEKRIKIDESKHLCHRNGCRISLSYQSILFTTKRAVVTRIAERHPSAIPHLCLLYLDKLFSYLEIQTWKTLISFIFLVIKVCA